jgi:hypothetical protein
LLPLPQLFNRDAELLRLPHFCGDEAEGSSEFFDIGLVLLDTTNNDPMFAFSAATGAWFIRMITFGAGN